MLLTCPDEVLDAIVMQLPVHDVLSCAIVCSRLHHIVNAEQIWRRLCGIRYYDCGADPWSAFADILAKDDIPLGNAFSHMPTWRRGYAAAVRGSPLPELIACPDRVCEILMAEAHAAYPGFEETFLRGIYAFGFEKFCGTSGRAVLPIALAERDVFLQSHLGCGKTSVLVMGVLGRMRSRTLLSRTCFIVTPTTYLANQTFAVATELFQYLHTDHRQGSVTKGRARVYLLSGDADEVVPWSVTSRPMVVVGHASAVLHVLPSFDIGSVDMCFDEADVLLSGGEASEDAVELARRCSLGQCRVVACSAGPPPLAAFPRLHRPLVMRTDLKDLIPATAQHKFLLAPDYTPASTCAVIKQLLAGDALDLVGQAVIFPGREEEALAAAGGWPLLRSGDDVRNFRRADVRVLCARDADMRGLDVHFVNTVLSCGGVPGSLAYARRAGQCVRWGRTGTVVSIVTQEDIPALQDMYHVLDVSSTSLEL